MRLECLDTLVGYIEAACDCLPSIPNTITTPHRSDTGFFVSNLMPTDFSTKCSNTTIWNTLKSAKDDAKISIVHDLKMHWEDTGHVKRSWTGYLGQEDGQSIAKPAGSSQSGFYIDIKRHRRNIYMTIDQIMVRTASTAGDYTLVVKDQYGNQVGQTNTITIESGDNSTWKVKKLTNPVSIPMWNDNEEPPKYYVFTDLPQVWSNITGCMSCTKPHWFDYMELSGAFYDTDFRRGNDVMHGIRPRITIECDFDGILCNSGKNTLAAAGATLYYKWAITALEFIINSGSINTYTALGGEYLEGLISQHSMNYRKNLSYLASQVNTGECVTCDPAVKLVSHRI